MLSKGADSKIFSKLAPGGENITAATSGYLAAWGEDGLRTLCFGYRQIPEDEFEVWFERYSAALRDDAEKAKFDRKIFPNAIDDAMTAIESGLLLQVCVCALLTFCWTARTSVGHGPRYPCVWSCRVCGCFEAIGGCFFLP